MKHIGRKHQGGWAWVWPAITAAASVVGGLLGKKGQQSANETNIELQREQQDWEERMSSTSIQRRVQDLQQAGLNPMLAYQSEASTPSVSAARVENTERDLGQGIANAGTASMLALQRKQIEAQIENTNADTIGKRANSTLTAELAKKATYETALSANTASQVGITNAQQKAAWEKTSAEIEEILERAKSTREGNLRSQEAFALEQAIRDAQVQLQRAGIPEAQANAQLWNSIAGAGKAGQFGGELLKILKTILKQ